MSVLALAILRFLAARKLAQSRSQCPFISGREHTSDALVWMIETLHTNNNGLQYLENVTGPRQCTFPPNLLGYCMKFQFGTLQFLLVGCSIKWSASA